MNSNRVNRQIIMRQIGNFAKPKKFWRPMIVAWSVIDGIRHEFPMASRKGREDRKDF
jgi:hypothetical protein